MGKAVIGMSITTIISLILALVALILIWWFHEKVFTFFKDVLLRGIENLIIKTVVCKIFVRIFTLGLYAC
jgi:hypothetical protein